MDVVFLWVNESNPRVARQLQKAQRMWSNNEASDGGQAMRYRSFGELELAVASVNRFAVGVNRMFLITSGERPTFQSDLQLIKHSSFIPRSRLPTFSTHAIHAHLYRLSKRLTNPFLLFDDDIMLTRRLDLNVLHTRSTNHLASEGRHWPLRPLSNKTFARGVQNSVHAIQKKFGAAHPRQNVPSHTPQLCHFETLFAVARIFKYETLEHPYHPFRSLQECNLRVLWNAVDRRFQVCNTQPGDRVSHFLEMGLWTVEKFSYQLCRVRDSPKHYLTINDAIADTDPETLSRYTAALAAFYVWLGALYAENGTYSSARRYGNGMQCYNPPPPPPPPPSPPPSWTCVWLWLLRRC